MKQGNQEHTEDIDLDQSPNQCYHLLQDQLLIITGAFSNNNQKSIHKLIKDHGGRSTKDKRYLPKANALIVGNRTKKANDTIKQAQNLQIPIVSEDWLSQSILKGALQSKEAHSKIFNISNKREFFSTTKQTSPRKKRKYF